VRLTSGQRRCRCLGNVLDIQAVSEYYREALNKFPRTSCRHIFPLAALKNLEIRKVFLRFFALPENKSDDNLHTLIYSVLP
jgi:hypothetical protein